MRKLILSFAAYCLLGMVECHYEHSTAGFQQFPRSHLPMIKPGTVQVGQDDSMGLFVGTDVASRQGELFEPNAKLGALTYPTSKNEYGELNLAYAPHNPEMTHQRFQQEPVYYHPQQMQRIDRRYFSPHQQELTDYETLYRNNGSPYELYKGEIPQRRTYQEAAINYQPQQRFHEPIYNLRANPEGNQYQPLYSHSSQHRPTSPDYQKHQYVLQEANSAPYPNHRA